MLKSYLFILLLLSAAISVYSHGGGSDSDSYLDADSDADSTSPKDLRSKSLILVKIYCLILVFLGTFIGGVSPYFFKWNEAFLVLGTQFAGGVFLGTAMMHFLSDSNETFEDLVQDIEYPFAFMLACGGYLLTMLADCVINFVVAKKEGTKMNDSGAVGEHGVGAENKAGHNGGISLPQSDVEHGAHGKSVQEVLSHASSYGDSILLIVALCFHSVFEGIAIGVAESKADAWKALWTICLHKIFAAIAMGIALLRMMPNRPLLSTFSYAFAFAISSPVGVAIGIVIDATTEARILIDSPIPEIPTLPKPELPPLPEIPTLPKPELPTIPEIPKPGHPQIPELIPTLPKTEFPPLPDLLKIPAISKDEKSPVPAVPASPKPELPPLSVVPALPKPELPPLPELPKFELPPLPEFPSIPGVHVPKLPIIPAIPSVPNAPTVQSP